MEAELHIAGGKPVRVACIKYADTTFLTISELATFGTIMTCSLEIFPDGTQHFDINTLVGVRDNDELLLLCRRLGDWLYKDTGMRTLTLSVALQKDHLNMEYITPLLKQLQSMKPWLDTAKISTPASIPAFTSTIRAGPGSTHEVAR